MKNFARQALWLVPLLGVLFLPACATNPVTGQQELMLLSESSEIQMGRQTDGQIEKTYGFYDSPSLNAYIQGLGQRVAQVSHRSHLPFEFKVLDTPVVNAFAVPGGYIYLTRGILAYLNDEAEVAGVIGHEIGHVAARHSAQQYTRATFAQIGLGLGTILSEEIAALSGVAQMGVQMLFLKFSRDNERQADRLGVEYATRAGYDASKMADFFHTLERLHPSSDSGMLPDWFSTHPAPEQRVSTVRSLAIKQARLYGSRQQDLKTKRSAYLEELDGLVFGEDPRQGYVEADLFYHPQLRFYFPSPDGWQLTNIPARVQIVNPNKSAAIVFSIDAEPSLESAAQRFATETNAQILKSKTMSLNSLPATMLIADIAGNQQKLRTMSTFIAYEEKIYRFVGFCPPEVFARYQSTFEKTMTGFAPLSDPEKLNITPDRVRVFRTDSQTTLRQALTSQGVKKADLETAAVLNGKRLDDSVPGNTLLKWVEKANR